MGIGGSVPCPGPCAQPCRCPVAAYSQSRAPGSRPWERHPALEAPEAVRAACMRGAVTSRRDSSVGSGSSHHSRAAPLRVTVPGAAGCSSLELCGGSRSGRLRAEWRGPARLAGAHARPRSRTALGSWQIAHRRTRRIGGLDSRPGRFKHLGTKQGPRRCGPLPAAALALPRRAEADAPA